MKIEIRDHDHAVFLACIWIEQKLEAGHQQISYLIREFTKDTLRKDLSERIDLLNEARRELGIEAFLNEEDRFAWRARSPNRHSHEYTTYLSSPT